MQLQPLPGCCAKVKILALQCTCEHFACLGRSSSTFTFFGCIPACRSSAPLRICATFVSFNVVIKAIPSLWRPA